jgi:hypothetical protein
MSDRQTLAEHGTGLGLAVAGLAAGGPLAALLVPGAVLGALARDTYAGCADRGARRAMARALAALDHAPDFPDADIGAALALFLSRRRDLHIDPAQLAGWAAGPDPTAAALRAVFGAEFDRQEPGVQAALRAAIAPALDAARRDAEFDRVFVQEVTIGTLRAQGVIRQGLDRIEGRQDAQTDILRDLQKRMGDIAAALDQPQALTLEELRWLAAQFGAAPDQSRAALIAFLAGKAQEYHAFQADIAAIDDRTRGLGNLKAAAQDAAGRLDFDAVEALLSRVHEVEVTIAAETAELRAGNALLRGRAAQAFDLLSAAADSFAGIDPVEAARRRVRYGAQLGQHGERFGGPGLTLAETMLRQALDGLDENHQPRDRAAAQNALAIVLTRQAERTAGAAGAALLAGAVDACRAALRVRTEADHPLDWAMTMQNLGNALQCQGEATAGAAGAVLLAEAVDSFRAALRVVTEADHPLDWAMTMQNLGTALLSQAERTGGAAGAALLAKAVESFRAALRMRTEADHPLQWAMTMQNLGNALLSQSDRAAGEAGTALLAGAVESHRAALRVFTEADHPLQWAGTMQNLGGVLLRQGEDTAGAAGAALLAGAADAYRAALRVRTEADHPLQWARTMQNLGIALATRGARTGGAALLAKAAESFRAALRVFTEADHPLAWAATMQNRGIALKTQGARTGGAAGAALLAGAADSFRAALRVFTEADHPPQWAMIQENMAILEQARARHDVCADPAPHLRAALDHVAAALTVYDPAHTPHDHGTATRLRDHIRAALAALPGG